MNRVFVVQQPNAGRKGITYDVTPALQHGEIKYVFPRGFQASLDSERAYEIAESVLDDFDVENDFVVWAGGDPVALMVVTAVLCDVTGYTPIKYLRWERSRSLEGSGFYDVCELKLYSNGVTND